MIVSIAGVNAGADLSTYLIRENFEIDAAIGKRIDTSRFRLMDTIPGTFNIPGKAEVVMYDAAANSAVTDPPWAISAYNTQRNGAGTEVTSTNPANWTPRLFGGYIATPEVVVIGRQRYIDIQAQDYTVRLRTTIVNMAFAGGLSDQAILKQVFARYRPDYDTTNVNQIIASYPAISFPVHTLEQFIERILKVSRGYYRADYFKRMFYGSIGLQVAPFNFSDQPDGATTFGFENLTYRPDGASLVNRVWVLGSTYLSQFQDYQVPSNSIDGTAYQFSLPGNPDKTGMTVKIGAADQGFIGVVPGDGDIANRTTFKYNVVIQHSPALVAFKTPPAAGSTIIVHGQFRYPLVQIVTDQSLINLTNGVIFEAVLRDKRINDVNLAKLVGQTYLKNQGQALNGGRLLAKQRGLAGTLLQPGQQITIRSQAHFEGGVVKDVNGNPTITAVAIITAIKTTLTEDVTQPYEIEVNFADRHVSGGY